MQRIQRRHGMSLGIVLVLLVIFTGSIDLHQVTFQKELLRKAAGEAAIAAAFSLDEEAEETAGHPVFNEEEGREEARISAEKNLGDMEFQLSIEYGESPFYAEARIESGGIHTSVIYEYVKVEDEYLIHRVGALE